MASISRARRRVTLHKKLHILNYMGNSKSVKRSSAAMNAALYMYKLKVMLESVKREYANLIATRREYLKLLNHVQVPKDVKVEKLGRGFMVKLTCEKGGERLVKILEAFEKMCFNVQQARISSKDVFALEAIVVPEDHSHDHLDVTEITKALTKAIE